MTGKVEFDFEQYKKEKEAELNQALEKLEQGVKEVFRSGRLKEYLQVMAKFYSYSVYNTLWIYQQNPQATHVAGYQKWKKDFGRQVKKGETGMSVLIPVFKKQEQPIYKKDENGVLLRNSKGEPVQEGVSVSQVISFFKIGKVFDVSQTEGRELPALAERLSGSFEQMPKFFEALKKVASMPVELVNIGRDINGYYSSRDNRIVLQKGLSGMQTIKTMIHEIAHSKLHNPDQLKKDKISRNAAEVQAEGTAFVVCLHFGIDASQYSFDYVASWSLKAPDKLLRESLEIIRKTASIIISETEKYLSEPELSKNISKQEPLKSGFDEIFEGLEKGIKTTERSPERELER